MSNFLKNIIPDSTSHGRWLVALYLLGHLLLPIRKFEWHADVDSLIPETLGTALPDGVWLNRSTLLGIAFLAGALWQSGGRITRIRWNPFDGLMAGWLLIPLVVGPFNDSPLFADGLQSLYLIVTWGAPYLAGRLLFSSAEDLRWLLRIVVLLGAISVPFALLELIAGRFCHRLLYGFTPFQVEGEERFFGSRPLLLFEDPNQIGMWWCTVALAALAVWRLESRGALQRLLLTGLALTPFLFQSIGGSLLTLLGGGILFLRPKWIRPLLITAGLVVVLLFAARGPLLRMGRGMVESSGSAGREVKQLLRHSSIGSFGWRMGQEDRNWELLGQRPVFGWGTVSFWEQAEEPRRPWGMATMITGAYGAVGLASWGAAMLAPILAIGWGWTRRAAVGRLVSGVSHEAWFCSVILLMHVVDAGLNSSFFVPMLMWLGALGMGAGWYKGPS